MIRFFEILKKDFRQIRMTLGPAMFFCLPLLLFLSIGSEFSDQPQSFALLSFWISYFVGQTSLFYRSFAMENRFQCFHLYTVLQVPRLHLFLSQSMANFAGSILIGVTYLVIAQIFWSSPQLSLAGLLPVIFLLSFALAPLGTLLSLLLQMEREFLFSLFFLPVSTPLFLGALALSSDGSSVWYWVIGVFVVVSTFLSAFLFEFFFDELTQ